MRAALWLLPVLALTSLIRERRVAVDPTASGAAKYSRPPAHIRRGSVTGGRKPPRLGWPSGPRAEAGLTDQKNNQCQSGGSASPSR